MLHGPARMLITIVSALLGLAGSAFVIYGGLQMMKLKSWPISISYYEDGNDKKDALPSYELAFLYFENGVSRRLTERLLTARENLSSSMTARFCLTPGMALAPTASMRACSTASNTARAFLPCGR